MTLTTNDANDRNNGTDDLVIEMVTQIMQMMIQMTIKVVTQIIYRFIFLGIVTLLRSFFFLNQ